MTTWIDTWPDDYDEFTGRWDWCNHCGSPFITCNDCGNNSCNGGGCSRCKEYSERVSILIKEGKHPFVEKYNSLWDNSIER